MRTRILCLGLGLSAVLAGCGKKQLAPDAYQTYLRTPENGLQTTVERKGNKAEISFEPLEWQAFRAAYSENSFNRDLFDGYREKNRGLLRFSFKLFLPGHADLYGYFAGKYENPEEAMLYSEYDLKDDFSLLAGESTDSLRPFAVHHQPSFGLKPYEEFLVLFQTGDADIENKALRLFYNDYLFGLDTLSFRLDSRTMHNIPKLKL